MHWQQYISCRQSRLNIGTLVKFLSRYRLTQQFKLSQNEQTNPTGLKGRRHENHPAGPNTGSRSRADLQIQADTGTGHLAGNNG